MQIIKLIFRKVIISVNIFKMWLIIFILCVILIFTLFVTVCHYATENRKHWLKRNIPYREPCPIFGNFGATLTTRISYTQMLRQFYEQYSEFNYVGIFQARRPALMVINLDIIKQVLSGQFSCFSDRVSVNTDTQREPLLRNLSNMSGAEWKAMRQIVTPTFSSAKMKAMFPLITDCAESLREVILSDSAQETDVANIASRYVTDVIGSCAFGVNPGSLKDSNSPFLIMSQKMFKLNAITILRRYCRIFFPRLFRMLNLRSYPSEVEKFFTSIISQVLTERRRTGKHRDDFLQLMMNQQNNETELKITDALITSNSFIFMLAGLETTSITLSFCLYEVAKKKELQDELRKEINLCWERYNGLNYESVSAMKLLSQTVLETLRMHPSTPLTTRLCTQPCQLPETEINMKVKEAIIIPIHAIHKDRRNFTDPDKFDPSRFEGENPAGFLAFGDGPRSCPGEFYIFF